MSLRSTMVGKCVRVGVLDGEETTEPERGPSLALPKDPRAFAFLPSTSMAAIYRREDQELPSMRYVRVPDITRSSPRGRVHSLVPLQGHSSTSGYPAKRTDILTNAIGPVFLTGDSSLGGIGLRVPGAGRPRVSGVSRGRGAPPLMLTSALRLGASGRGRAVRRRPPRCGSRRG